MSLEKNLKDIIKDKEESAKKGFGIGNIIETVSPFLAFVNLPLAITAGATGLALDSIAKKKSLISTMMPDEWLKKVAESKDVSDKGLNFLREKIAEKETISVSDALIFLEIENEHEKSINKNKKEPIKEIINEDKFSGIKALKERFKEVEKKEVKITNNFSKNIAKNIIEIGPRAIGLFMTIKGKGIVKK